MWFRYHSKLQDTVKNSGMNIDDYTIEEVEKDYVLGLPVGITFCMGALPMILCDPKYTLQFANVDFNDAEKRKDFEKEAQAKTKTILTEDVRVRSRLRGVLDELIENKVI